MQPITVEDFKTVLRELIAKEKNRDVVLVQDIEEEQDLKLATVYSYKDGKLGEREHELQRSELERWIMQKGSPTYLLVNETPYHMRSFETSHEGVKVFRELAIRLSSIVGPSIHRAEAYELLDDMVSMFKSTEESSYRIADAYIEDIPKV